MLIGLGTRAERILDQLHATDAIPDDVGVYRSGWAALHPATNWLGQRLERTAVSMLLIDPDDPAARVGAQDWAQRLIDAGIDLSVALVLESRGVDPDPAWRAALGLPVIEVRANAQGLAESKIVDAMLPALPYCQPALFGVHRFDLHAVLSTGSQGWTTAVYSRSPEDCGSAVARAFADLPLIRPAGVMVWITTGIEFSIGEFDAMLHALNMQVDEDTVAVISPYIDRGYAKGERLLSLTVIGD